MSECRMCTLVKQRETSRAAWQSILPAAHFTVAHADNSSLPGWTVMASNRHVASLDQLTEEEAVELGVMIRRISIALKAAVGCDKTYVLQFAEKVPHIHVHIVPRMPDLEEGSKGPKIFNYMDVAPPYSVPVSTRNDIASRMRRALR